MLSYQLFMNPHVFANLVTGFVFDKLPEDTYLSVLNTMSRPGETASTTGVFTSKGATPEVMIMEAPIVVPMVPRSPRPNPTPIREVPKPKKGKKKKPMLVHGSWRKHATTQAQKKEKERTKDKGKVVYLETEDGAYDIETEGMYPISKLPHYIPPPKGKVKITKDLDVDKFLIHTPLLLEKITFKGLHLV